MLTLLTWSVPRDVNGVNIRHDANMSATDRSKTGYHHGDLQNALVDAATELARDGGPEAVVLRAAARRVGVSATAAYRHFANQTELLAAVKVRGQQALADRMEGALRAPRDGDAESARGRMYDLGRGYVDFAVAEPGLYRTAFCRVTPEERESFTGRWVAGDDPQFRSFNLLAGLLDEQVAAGLMPAEARPGAEFAAWSTVHGLAMLILDGPLSLFPQQDRDAVVDRVLTAIVTGLTSG
jgi:AcrR family transcriptional regulator